VPLSTTLANYANTSTLNNVTLEGTIDASDATLNLTSGTLAATTAAVDVIAQYTQTNTNVASSYNTLVSSGTSAFSAGNLVFQSSSDYLSVPLVTRANVSIANSALGLGMWMTVRFGVLPSVRAVIAQIGSQNAVSGNSLAVTLEPTGLLVLRLSSSDYRAYTYLVPNTNYELLVNKNATSVCELWVNGALLTATSTGGTPTHTPLIDNLLVLGQTSAGLACYGLTLSNLVILLSSTIYTPMTVAALQLGVPQSSFGPTGLVMYAPTTIKKSLVAEGRTTLGSCASDTVVVNGALQIAPSLFVDTICCYDDDNANTASSYNNLSGTLSFSGGTVTFGATTDYLTTSLLDTSGSTIAGVSTNNTCVAFQFSYAYFPASASLIFQIGSKSTSVNDSLTVLLGADGTLQMLLSTNNYYTYGVLTANQTYSLLINRSVTTVVELWQDGVLITGTSTGSPTFAAYNNNTLTLGYSAANTINAIPGATISNLFVAFGPTLYTPTSFAGVVGRSTLSSGGTVLNMPVTFNNTLTANTLTTKALTFAANPGHTNIIASYFSNTNLVGAGGSLSIGSGSASFVNGSVTFVNATDYLTGALVTRASAGGVSIAATTGVNTAITFQLYFTALPSGTVNIIQIGTQNGTIGNSVAITLNSSGQVVIWLANGSVSKTTYTTLVPYVSYTILVNKSASTNLEYYQNGVLQSGGTTIGSLGYSAFNSNTIYVGASPLIPVNTLPGMTISGLSIAFSTILYTPTTFAALQQPLAQSNLGASSSTLNMPTTFNNTLTVNGDVSLGSSPNCTVSITGNLIRVVPILSRYQNVAQTGVAANTDTIVTFDTLDVNMSQGNTGLTYSAGVFTNSAASSQLVNITCAIGARITASYLAAWVRYTAAGYNGGVAANFSKQQFPFCNNNATKDGNNLNIGMSLLMAAGSTFSIMCNVGTNSGVTLNNTNSVSAHPATIHIAVF
jgi:hypothetical protein